MFGIVLQVWLGLRHSKKILLKIRLLSKVCTVRFYMPVSTELRFCCTLFFQSIFTWSEAYPSIGFYNHQLRGIESPFHVSTLLAVSLIPILMKSHCGEMSCLSLKWDPHSPVPGSRFCSRARSRLAIWGTIVTTDRDSSEEEGGKTLNE